MNRPSRRRFRPDLDVLDGRCLLTGLTPLQVTGAYGLDAVAFASNGQTIKGDGTGQTIAIVDAFHDPYLASDLQKFDQTYGLADPTLNIVNLAGARTDDGWAGEETLDVEWAHAIAPGAKILVVEARSDSLTDLLAAVDVARNTAGVTTVSMSWGSSEFRGQTAYDSYFTTPAGHQGITFVAASGDGGASAGAQWPASSANVLSVGGTTLSIGASGVYSDESTWSGGGGGYSNYVLEPSYQATLQNTGRRSSPDVAFDANPNTGVSVLTTSPSTGQTSWYQVGGTSLGAPAWSAIVAIADQGRALAGLSSLDGASQTLPTLYQLPAADFHKVAGVTATGLGSPNGVALVNGLAFGSSATGSQSSASTTTTSTTATTTSTTPPATPPTGRHRRGWNRHGRGRAAIKAIVATTEDAATHRVAPSLGLGGESVLDALDSALNQLASHA